MDPGALEEKKVEIALSFITKGVVAKWAATREARLIEDRKYERIRTLSMFIEKLKAAFDDPDKGSTAQAKIEGLKQRGRPFEQFLVEFELLEYDTELGETLLIDWLKKGMDERLWDMCYHDRPLPNTLQEWKDSASIHDRRLRRKDEEQRARRGYGQRRDEYPAQRPYNPPRIPGYRPSTAPINATAPVPNIMPFRPASAPYQPFPSNPVFPARGNSTTNRDPNSGPVPMDVDRARQQRPQGYMRQPG